jgi:hypothetical protein
MKHSPPLLFLLLACILSVTFTALHQPAPVTARPVAQAEATPAAPQPPPLQPGGFITVEGGQFTRLGQPVTIKGVNYYPRGRPWAEMWFTWDGQQVADELQMARDQLGINAVRILLPYDVPRESAITRLREVAQIAGNLDMRLIVTLFDFHDHFPAAGSAEYGRHVRYLEDLLGNFVGDERIMAWDLHNEPDHYKTWQEGKASRVLAWLSNIAREVKRLAPHHLVTVGMGQYDNLWQPGPDGQRVIDYSDFISVHIYNAPDTARQLYELRTHTTKPILLGEFGWPSGPRCAVPEYNEQTQAWVYRTILEQSAGQVAGILAWTLRDFHSGPTKRWDTREEHYGLYRPDHSLKPAAQTFAAFAAPPLPSITSSNVPITQESINPPGGKFAPKFIPESGHYVKGWFRIAWEEFGGRGTFGLPLGEAFVRPTDQMVVQYFEAAMLEYHPDATSSTYEEITRRERAMRLISPVDLGKAYTVGRTFPQREVIPDGGRRFSETGYTIQGEFRRFYEGISGEWRLGAPISEELVEEINGVPTRVQYFQKGRLELNPTTGVIQMGHLGGWAFNMHCY